MLDEQQTSDLNEQSAGWLEHLRKQERVWFNWVCRLHDVHAGTQTPQSAAILSVARRRWADAGRVPARAETRMSRPPESFGSREARAQTPRADRTGNGLG